MSSKEHHRRLQSLCRLHRCGQIATLALVLLPCVLAVIVSAFDYGTPTRDSRRIAHPTRPYGRIAMGIGVAGLGSLIFTAGIGIEIEQEERR